MCSIEGCEGKILARGWCNKHYKRWYATGDPTLARPRGGYRPTSLQNVLSQTRVDAAGCWITTHSLDGNGYSRVSVDNKTKLTHRIVYELVAGPISPGLDAHHTCHTRNCINPFHLKILTRQEHAVEHGKGSDTCAKCGESNWKYRPSGRRDCRTCQTETMRRWRAARKATP